jgi:type IV pilus assembly protein PilA
MSKTIRKGEKGFTLIELMIVVAIIGILAAIAIPNFLRFQLKSKTSEGKVNLAAIRTAEEAYLAEFGAYVSSNARPTGTPSTTKLTWNEADTDGFGTLGWSPEGNVFFQYAVGTDANDVAYFATAQADLDGNATPQTWGYDAPALNPAGAVAVQAVPVHACGVGGTGLEAIKQVGPCDAAAAAVFGQSVF